MPYLLLAKIGFIGVVCAGGFAYIFHLGDVHGSNARAYRAVVAELKTKNTELQAARADDERQIPILEAARNAAHAAALGAKTCAASKDTAKRLSAIRE